MHSAFDCHPFFRGLEQQVTNFGQRLFLCISVATHYLEIINFLDIHSTNAVSKSFNAKIKEFRTQFRKVKDRIFFLFDRLVFMYEQ